MSCAWNIQKAQRTAQRLGNPGLGPHRCTPMNKPSSVQKNVLGHPLISCSLDPATGFYRDGYCHHCEQDSGNHCVCSTMTTEFLKFSLSRGNNLISPHTESGFPGLKPGDCWCLCAHRWLEAYEHGNAPPVKLQSTHEAALQTVSLFSLKKHATDLN